jgi:hypothetical protein
MKCDADCAEEDARLFLKPHHFQETRDEGLLPRSDCHSESRFTGDYQGLSYAGLAVSSRLERWEKQPDARNQRGLFCPFQSRPQGEVRSQLSRQRLSPKTCPKAGSREFQSTPERPSEGHGLEPGCRAVRQALHRLRSLHKNIVRIPACGTLSTAGCMKNEYFIDNKGNV